MLKRLSAIALFLYGVTANGQALWQDLEVKGALTLGTPLAVTSGGTGADNSGSAAVNILPDSGKGSIVVFDGTSQVALPVGSDGQYLQADSNESSGIKWAAAASGSTNSIDNTDSPYSASWGETIFADSSGGAITINLPSASGQAGQTITIKLVAAGNTLTIDGNSSETIDGNTTHELRAAKEYVVIGSDGTNTNILASEYFETVSNSANPNSVPGSGWREIGSVTLGPGTWDISGRILYRNTSTTASRNNANVCVSDNGGNDGDGCDQVESSYTQICDWSVGTFSRCFLEIEKMAVSLSTSDVYYLKSTIEQDSDSLLQAWDIIAVRRN